MPGLADPLPIPQDPTARLLSRSDYRQNPYPTFLRQARLLSGLSMTDLAAQAGLKGCGALSMYERGLNRCGVPEYRQGLARVLGVQERDIFDPKGFPKPARTEPGLPEVDAEPIAVGSRPDSRSRQWSRPKNAAETLPGPERPALPSPEPPSPLPAPPEPRPAAPPDSSRPPVDPVEAQTRELLRVLEEKAGLLELEVNLLDQDLTQTRARIAVLESMLEGTL